MQFKIAILGFFIFLFFTYSFIKRRNKKPFKSYLLDRFRKRFKSKNRLREKLKAEFAESLMTNPMSNIQIGIWDEEDDLREKADIHRARLAKYGKSKMNGEVFFMGPKGGVYKLTDEGKKKYV